eukprot:6906315-Prymnesium_polylepis.1
MAEARVAMISAVTVVSAAGGAPSAGASWESRTADDEECDDESDIRARSTLLDAPPLAVRLSSLVLALL